MDDTCDGEAKFVNLNNRRTEEDDFIGEGNGGPGPEELNVEGLQAARREDILNMVFDDVHDAEVFYKKYATALGFGIRKNSNRYKNGVEVMKQFCCNKQGQREQKWLTYNNRRRIPKAMTRIDCKANLRIVRTQDSGKWVVSQFEETHNHDMVSVSEKCFIRSNRKVTETDIAEAKLMKQSGVRTSQVMNYFAHQAGGIQNVGFTKKDLYNSVLAESKSEILEGDVNAVLMYLDIKSSMDEGLYYRYTKDSENRLEHLFWADCICRSDYTCFGDVLAFDTTYKKNGYNRPLMILLGVNNHHQTTIFGFALLANETIETFEWVLTTFMHAMGGKKPISVVTDGDRAMERAIKSIFPTSRHRLCVWHLSRNAKTNIPDVSFVKDFKTCMLSWWTQDGFEKAWARLIAKYDLLGNAWINEKYKTRFMWAQAYLSGHFFGYLKTTSRCEGMNSYLKKFIDTKGTLLQFVRAIDTGLSNIRYNELDADFKSRHTKPVLSHPMSLIESHAASVYTRKSYFKFLKEMQRESLYFSTSNPIANGHNRTHNLVRYRNPGKEIQVTYNMIEQTINCSCMKFETDGIPCRHVIHVMKLEHMSCIPKSCILHRWTINAKDCTSIITGPYVNSEDIQKLRFGSLKSECNQLCFISSRSTEAYTVARSDLARLTAKMEELCKVSPSNDDGVRPVRHVHDPIKQKSKGKVTGKRKNESKPRNCGHCKELGHTKRNCPALEIALGSIAGSNTHESNTDIDSSDEDALYDRTQPGNVPYETFNVRSSEDGRHVSYDFLKLRNEKRTHCTSAPADSYEEISRSTDIPSIVNSYSAQMPVVPPDADQLWFNNKLNAMNMPPQYMGQPSQPSSSHIMNSFQTFEFQDNGFAFPIYGEGEQQKYDPVFGKKKLV